MPKAFALIKTRDTKEHEIYNKLIKTKEIKEIHPLFGSYDLIIKIDLENLETLGKLIVDKIKIIDGIIDTKTLTGTDT